MTIDEKMDRKKQNFGFWSYIVEGAAKGEKWCVTELPKCLDKYAKSGDYQSLTDIANHEELPEQIRKLAEERVEKAARTLVDNSVLYMGFLGLGYGYACLGYKRLILLSEDERISEDIRDSAKERIKEMASGLIEGITGPVRNSLDNANERISEAQRYLDTRLNDKPKNIPQALFNDYPRCNWVAKYMNEIGSNVDLPLGTAGEAIEDVYERLSLEKGYEVLIEMTENEKLSENVRKHAMKELVSTLIKVKSTYNSFSSMQTRLDEATSDLRSSATRANRYGYNLGCFLKHIEKDELLPEVRELV
ncbi:MAG: hypothetical protein ABH824_02710 [Nanoarchaeota archaeon]